MARTVAYREQAQKDPPSRSQEGQGCCKIERVPAKSVLQPRVFGEGLFPAISTGIEVGMVRKCHFTLLLPRFTNRNSSRFQSRWPSICVLSKAPCTSVRIARIFAVPREPTTRTVSPGFSFMLPRHANLLFVHQMRSLARGYHDWL